MKLSAGQAKSAVIAIILIPLFATVAFAETYYVRIDGDNGNTGLGNSSGGAWQTIDYAADNISAGDVIRVQTGTYEERVTPGVDGSSVTNTVTFVADGLVTVCGFDFANNNYIRVIGFAIDADEGSCGLNSACVNISGTNNFLEFWNNTFRDARYNGIRCGASDSWNNSVVIGNILHNFGIGNGSGVAINSIGDNNLIAYNEVYNVHPDAFVMYGDNTRFLNNYVHDLSEESGGHSDCFQTGTNAKGWENNLLEATFQIGTGIAVDEHVAQISNTQGIGGDMTENVFRRNVWHNIGSGTVGVNQTWDGPVTYTRIYNNTTVDAQTSYPSNSRGLAIYGDQTSDTYILNNLEYDSWGDSITTYIDVYYVTGGLTSDYNLAYDPRGSVAFIQPFSTQPNSLLNAYPDLVDFDNDDFHIGSSSQAIGNAGPLAITSGSGTGTTFTVSTGGGGFFRGDNTNLSQYGGSLVVGDIITVGTDTVRVSSISSDSITVTEPFTWENGENVYFSGDASPDIGAYPYRANGYSFSAIYDKSEDTVTVAPSDPDLVRMVVVFEDGIPIGADSTNPYIVSGVGNGALDVRVYSLYASATLWVSALKGSISLPSPPSNLRIRD